MDDWHTIWDHEVAAFGKRSMVFGGRAGTYSVDIDAQNQDEISVTYRSGPLAWVVFRKSVCDGVFRLEGGTWGRGDPYWNENGGHWFELTLGAQAVLRYWGNQVLEHEDHEVAVETSKF